MMATSDDEAPLPALSTRPDGTRSIWASVFVVGTAIVILLASLDLHAVVNENDVPSAHVAQQRNRQALSKKILLNILNKTSTITSNKSDPISYIPPCGVATNVIESTSSLLVATALLKAGNATLQSWDMWQFFDALFPIPSSGFIPRFLYPVEKDTKSFPSFYVPHTRIPNWPIFSAQNTSESSPCRKNETLCWIGSGRISAIPFHGTFLLELVLQMEKREYISETDMLRLQHYWERIFDYHVYLHETVMRGCGYSNQTGLPCYNIVHPWESLMEPTSPAFQKALQPTLSRIDALNWSLPFAVPRQIEESYDYNATAYSATIFLAECLANQIRNGTIDDDDNYPYTFRGDAAAREEQILRECPFAMLDLGYASALAQADDDLYHVALWLASQGSMSSRLELTHSSPSWNSKLERFKQWRKQTKHVLRLLWNEGEQSYLSRYGVPSVSKSFPTMYPTKTSVTNNLMVFWKQWGDDATFNFGPETHLQEMTLQMLRHNGKYSFDCGSYPLWSVGCDDPTGIVDPRLNYFIGVGLFRNKDSVAAFGDYLTNATIDLICNQHQRQNESSTCADNATHFQEAYATLSSSALSLDECGRTSTTTAAILYHLLVDDFDFSFETPIPPIRNSWVITLITTELMIAFAVGVSCVGLSLSLVRQENRRRTTEDERDEGGSYMAIQNIENDEGVNNDVAASEQDIE